MRTASLLIMGGGESTPPFEGPHAYRRCSSGSANTKSVDPLLGTGISGVS
jgi:hypothetical protein